MGAWHLALGLIFGVWGLTGILAEEPNGSGDIEKLKRERAALERKIAELELKKKKEEEKPSEKENPPLDPHTVVVTANRMETPLKHLGVSASVVSAEKARATGYTEVQEILRSVPGLNFVRTANRGGTTSLFTRGGEADYTMVLLDGFKVNVDGGTFDFEHLTADNLSRIEVLRGAASAEYGSDAISGVVNVISRKGEGPPTLGFSLEGGNLGTTRERLRFQGVRNGSAWSVDTSSLKQDNGRFENSDFEDHSFAGRFDQQIDSETDLTLIVRSLKSKLGIFTTSAGQRFDKPDPNDQKTRNDSLTGLTLRRDVSDRWESSLRIFRYLQEVKFSTLRDEHLVGGGTGRDTADSFLLTTFDRTGVDWQNVFSPSDSVRIVAGIETENESIDRENAKPGSTTSTDIDENRSTDAVYLQAEKNFAERLFLSGGGRLDRHSDFGDEETGRASAAYLFPTHTKLRTSAGTGIKVPTFTEIHGTSTSPGLESRSDGVGVERSRTIDGGIDQQFFDGALRLSATQFYNRYKNLVEFESTAAGFGQGGGAYSRGTEWEVEWLLSKEWSLSANWTELKTKVLQTKTTGTAFVVGEKLLRRPDDAASLTGIHRPFGNDRVEASLTVRHVGTRVDRDFNASSVGMRIKNPSYTTLDGAAAWRFADGWRLFGSAQNLLNEEYEEVFGFPSDGVTFLVGVECEWRF